MSVILTAVLVLWLLGWPNPSERSHDLYDWFFYRDYSGDWWIAVGTWTYVALTAAIAFFAARAWQGSREQLTEMEKARKDAVHPLVVPGDADASLMAASDDEPATLVVKLQLRSIGPGPALQVVARVWLRQESWLAPFVTKEGTTNEGPFNEAAPTGWTEPIALGPGGLESMVLADEDSFAPFIPPSDPASHWVAYCVIEYRDIYGREFRYPDGTIRTDDAVSSAHVVHIVD